MRAYQVVGLLGCAVMCALIMGCVADDVEYNLVSHLMANYDPRIRPSRNSSEALNVTFGMALAQIIDVDEKNQIITSNCWLNQAWIDYKLVWDPKDFGGIRVVRLPWDAIWRPDVLLYNNADVSSYANQISSNMIVSNDGNVTWLSMVIFKSSCSIDVEYFPFDEQMCHLLFASWTYDGYQINLLKVGDDGDTSNYIPNSEWSLIKVHAVRNVQFYSCCAEPYPDVTYSIQMRRKPLFYVFNMILPCFIITFVALLGFYMPSDSGEKVTMGITTLLSMTVFLMLVAESMPPTSDVLPLIGLYYGITIGIVSLATACTVLTLNIHHKGMHGTEVPFIVKKICLQFIARILCMKQEEEHAPEEHFEPDVPEKTKAKSESSSSAPNWYIKLKPSHSSSHTHKTTVRALHNNSYYPINYPETVYKGEDAGRTQYGEGKCRGPAHQLRTTVNHIPAAHAHSPAMDIPEQRKPRENGGTFSSPRLPNSPIHARRQTGTGSPSFSAGTTFRGGGGGHDSSSTSSHTFMNSSTSPAMVNDAKTQQSIYSSPSHTAINTATNSAFEQQFIKTLQKVYQTIERNEIRLAEQDRRDVIKQDWQQVGLVVDRCMLGMFVVLTLSITIGLMTTPPQGWVFFLGQTVPGIGEKSLN